MQCYMVMVWLCNKAFFINVADKYTDERSQEDTLYT